jgi:hypothetical protein
LKKKLKKVLDNKFILLGIFIFSILYPSAGPYYFDGLPFLSNFENIYILGVLPIIIIVFFCYLQNRLVKIILILTFFLKCVLILYPNTGANIWQFENKDKYLINDFIPTYDTFWNRNKSFVQKQPWNKKTQFPIDWKYIDNYYAKGPKLDNISYRLRVSNHDEFEKINLIYKINFFIKVQKNSIFKLSANSCGDSLLYLTDINKNKIIKKFNCNDEIFLDTNNYEINGFISYKGGGGNNWSLDPQIKFLEKNDIFKSAYNEQIIFSNFNYSLNNNFFFKIFNLITLVYFSLVIFLPLFLLYLSLKNNLEYIKYLKLAVIFFSIFFFVKYFIFKITKFDQIDTYGSSAIAISIIIIIFFFNLIVKKKFFYNNINIKLIIFMVLTPTVVFFFINKHLKDIYDIYPFGYQDDWDVFEFYARQIVVEKKWLEAGEDIIVYRPAIRYIYAFYHILFGKSFFAFKIIEPWLVLLSGYFFYKVMIKLKIIPLLSFYTLAIFFVIFFGENVRWLLGRGLSELYALNLILFYLYVSIVSHTYISYKKFFILAFIGIIGVYFREEHLILYLFLIFSSFNSSNQKYLNESINKNIFLILLNIIKKNFKYLFFYWILIILGFSIIFVRNYYLSGEFGIIHVNMKIKFDVTHSIGRMLTGSEVQNTLIPRTYSIFLIFGFILSIYTLLKNNISNISYNFFLPISILSILLTYLIVNNSAYSPRFVVHYLVLTILIVSVFINNKIKKLV